MRPGLEFEAPARQDRAIRLYPSIADTGTPEGCINFAAAVSRRAGGCLFQAVTPSFRCVMPSIRHVTFPFGGLVHSLQALSPERHPNYSMSNLRREVRRGAVLRHAQVWTHEFFDFASWSIKSCSALDDLYIRIFFAFVNRKNEKTSYFF